MITSGEPGIMWEEALRVWCKITFWHFAALTGKVTEICHSSQKFLPNAEEGNILFILNILACELNLTSDTSGSSGRILTGHNSTDFETRKFRSEEVRLQGFTGGLEICNNSYKGKYMRNFVDFIPL
jgi:hypothetical protein